LKNFSNEKKEERMSTPNEPLFTKGDRVAAPNTADPNDGVPEHLRGKSPAEIVAFYEAKQTPPGTSATDFWSNPEAAARKTAEDVVDARLKAGTTPPAQSPPTQGASAEQVATAELLCERNHKDYPEFRDDVRKMVSNLPIEQQVKTITWETTFTFVKGIRYDSAIAAAEQRGRMPSEPVSPGSTPPSSGQPAALSSTEREVAAGLGLSPEAYQKGKERMEQNKWPLTFSNQQ
jgi:hypothetical protein